MPGPPERRRSPPTSSWCSGVHCCFSLRLARTCTAMRQANGGTRAGRRTHTTNPVPPGWSVRSVGHQPCPHNGRAISTGEKAPQGLGALEDEGRTSQPRTPAFEGRVHRQETTSSSGTAKAAPGTRRARYTTTTKTPHPTAEKARQRQRKTRAKGARDGEYSRRLPERTDAV